MSQKSRINHVIRALKQGGFFPEEKCLPGCINCEVKEAIEYFLTSKKGKNVSRVVNAFRTAFPLIFKDVPRSLYFISDKVKEATRNFIEKHYEVPIKVSSIPELQMMKIWEKQGPASGI